MNSKELNEIIETGRITAVEILINDIQKRIAFVENRHDEILDRIGFIEKVVNIEPDLPDDLPDSELYPIHKETL